MKQLTVIRTPLEVAVHLEEVKSNDIFGTRTEDLLPHLPYTSAQKYLRDDITEKAFQKVAAHSAEPGVIQEAAIKYLDFAVGKVIDHRGLSASRSIDHYRVWLWLLFPDADVQKFEAIPYPQYGAPQLKFAAWILGAENEWDRLASEYIELEAMAHGEPCMKGCQSGCDQ